MTFDLLFAAIGALLVWVLMAISKQLGAILNLLYDRLPPERPRADEGDED
jgi:hypothetical protein